MHHVQVNDLTPLVSSARSNARAAIELVDRINAANEIISSLQLHDCSSKLHECNSQGQVDALAAEFAIIDAIAHHLAQQF